MASPANCPARSGGTVVNSFDARFQDSSPPVNFWVTTSPLKASSSVGHTQRPRRAAELVPCCVYRSADDMGAGVGCPEDNGLVRGAERGVAAVRADQARTLVDGRKAQVTVRSAAQRLIFLQDRATHDVGAGVGGEEDLAAGEVLAEAPADRVDAAIAGPHRAGGTTAGVIRLVDRVGGIGFRGRRRYGRQHKGHCRSQQNCRCAADRGVQQGSLPTHPPSPLRQRPPENSAFVSRASQ